MLGELQGTNPNRAIEDLRATLGKEDPELFDSLVKKGYPAVQIAKEWSYWKSSKARMSGGK